MSKDRSMIYRELCLGHNSIKVLFTKRNPTRVNYRFLDCKDREWNVVENLKM